VATAVQIVIVGAGGVAFSGTVVRDLCVTVGCTAAASS
jgi:hypothetical protein